MTNTLDILFKHKKKSILNIYCTAGYPTLESTTEVMLALQQNGADIIEVGIPYSDPIADGPVIQQSNMRALENGITIEKIFTQLRQIKGQIKIPIILMGYLNPVLQYGMEKFCTEAATVGVSGIILPDLPMYEYENFYKKYFDENNLHLIFLVTPETSEERIRKADKLSKGFLYVVSSSATTGNNASLDQQQTYFEKLLAMKLKNPMLIGFGIKDKNTFDFACKTAAGAIIGSAYIKALAQQGSIGEITNAFVRSIID